MANGVNPDQTAPIGGVYSGSTLFASILNLSVILGNYLYRSLQQTKFQMHFILGALRVKAHVLNCLPKRPRKTAQTQIRLFLKKHASSDQQLPILLF